MMLNLSLFKLIEHSSKFGIEKIGRTSFIKAYASFGIPKNSCRSYYCCFHHGKHKQHN